MRGALLATIAALALAAPVQAAKPNTAKSPVSTTKPAPKPKPVGKAKDEAIPLNEELEHIVKEGETLGGIANRAQVPRVLIIEANQLQPPYAVKLGQKLILPRTRHHIVKKGETGFDIAIKYGVPFSAIAVANGLEPDAKLTAGKDLLIPSMFKTAAKPEAAAKPDAANTSESAESAPAIRLAWPIESKIRRGFAPRSKTDDNGDYHEGLDIPAQQGTAVRASAGGTVLFAGKEPERFGNLVVIDHENGWQTAYGFLSKVTVKVGETVKLHERVGLVGHAGQASRDELHFELRRANKPFDPSPYLPKAKKPEPKQDAKKAKPKA